MNSGRSSGSQSSRSIAKVILILAPCGSAGFRNRKGLDLWYQAERKKSSPFQQANHGDGEPTEPRITLRHKRETVRQL